jgi:hypothetical protein
MLANWISLYCLLDLYILLLSQNLALTFKYIHNAKPLFAHSPRVINGFKSILVLHLLIKYDMLRKYIDQKNFKLPLVDEILYSKMCLKRPSQPTDVHVKQINTTLTVYNDNRKHSSLFFQWEKRNEKANVAMII